MRQAPIVFAFASIGFLAGSVERGSAQETKPTATQTPSSLVPAGADTQLPRRPGLNYAIICIYPTSEPDRAKAARDFLISHGIPCTLEVIAWAPSWISLVGTAGFQKASDPDFKIYTANILKVAADMKTSDFEKPQPTGYRWQSTDHGLEH